MTKIDDDYNDDDHNDSYDEVVIIMRMTIILTMIRIMTLS